MSSSLWLHGPHQAPLSVGFSRQEYWSGLPCPPSRDLPNPGIEPRNTGVGSLPLFREILPTQELNQHLLHCRWILYQLCYQGSPATPYLQSKISPYVERYPSEDKNHTLAQNPTLNESACTESLQECALYPDHYGETSIFLWSPYLYYRYIFLSGNFSFHIKINIAKLIYVFEENLEKEIHKHSLEIATVKSLMHFLGINAY